jgi:hypothetical protein
MVTGAGAGGAEGAGQAGLVVFDREREVRAAAVHVARGGALGVQSTGYDSPVQVRPPGSGMIIGISFVLAPASAWAADDARHADKGGQQVHLAAVTVPGATGSLAVHPAGTSGAPPSRPWPAAARSPAALARSISQAPVTAPEATVSAPGDQPPGRGLRRCPGTGPCGPAPPAQVLQHVSGHAGGPPGDRVNDREPATTTTTTTAAASASTVATG